MRQKTYLQLVKDVYLVSTYENRQSQIHQFCNYEQLKLLACSFTATRYEKPIDYVRPAKEQQCHGNNNATNTNDNNSTNDNNGNNIVTAPFSQGTI